MGPAPLPPCCQGRQHTRQRLVELEQSQQGRVHRALAVEFREGPHPDGGPIDLMVCPGFPSR